MPESSRSSRGRIVDPIEKVNKGRYRLGPYEIVRSTWRSWSILRGHEIGCRKQSLIDVVPTLGEAVDAVRGWLAEPEERRP